MHRSGAISLQGYPHYHYIIVPPLFQSKGNDKKQSVPFPLCLLNIHYRKRSLLCAHSVSRTNPALSHSASSPSALSSGPKGSWPRGLSKGRRGAGGEKLIHVLADSTIQNRSIRQPESRVESESQTET